MNCYQPSTNTREDDRFAVENKENEEQEKYREETILQEICKLNNEILLETIALANLVMLVAVIISSTFLACFSIALIFLWLLAEWQIAKVPYLTGGRLNTVCTILLLSTFMGLLYVSTLQNIL